MERLNGLFLLCVVLCLAFVFSQNACENDDDDSDNGEPADDDGTDDDSGDDDAGDDDDNEEIGAYYFYQYQYEIDLICPAVPERLRITNPSTCVEGDEPYPINLHGIVNKGGITPAVHFLDYLPHRLLRAKLGAGYLLQSLPQSR